VLLKDGNDARESSARCFRDQELRKECFYAVVLFTELDIDRLIVSVSEISMIRVIDWTYRDTYRAVSCYGFNQNLNIFRVGSLAFGRFTSDEAHDHEKEHEDGQDPHCYLLRQGRKEKVC